MSRYARKAKSFAIVALVAFAMAFGFMCVPQGHAQAEGGSLATADGIGAQDAKTVDEVKAEIAALLEGHTSGGYQDPSSYSLDDADAIDSVLADFEALSADDQAQLDTESSSVGQPYGRVLEAAHWAILSYNEIDNSTTLPDGTYDASSNPALSSEYSKGKSTSARQKPWSVKNVTVQDGKATATITVESNTYTGIWKGGKTYPKTNESGFCEFANVPIDLNSTFYFAGISTMMPVPIAFSLTTTIEEPPITLADGTYKLPDLAAGPSATFNHFVAESKQLVVSGDTATIQFVTDGSTASIQKYSKIALGKSSELVQTQYQQEIDPSVTVIEGQLQPANEGDPSKYLFEIPLAKSDVEALLSNDVAEDIYITLWNKEGSSTDRIPGWYKANKDIYLSLGTFVGIDLDYTNNAGMFKAVSASVEMSNNGSTTLVVALSGPGYQEMFKGTYEQAVANGNNTDAWIHGATNAAGKWEFRIPFGRSELLVPVVSVSNTYYQGYLNGENSLERSFYPRQFEIDIDARTLVVADYESSKDLTVTNNVSMFSPGASAVLNIVGGPNSNNYKANLVLPMTSTKMTNVFVGAYADAVAADESIAFDTENNTFTIPVKWVETPGKPETLKSLCDGKPFYLSFKSSKGWYERKAALDEEAGTLTFNPSKADYSAVEAAQAKVPAEQGDYTDGSWEALQTALGAVQDGRFESQQAEVDAWAQAIEDAISALKPKVVQAVEDAINSDDLDVNNPNPETLAQVVEAYDALTDEQKALVSQGAKNKLAAAKVVSIIGGLPSAGAATEADQDAANKAKAAYDALTDEQKALIDPAVVTKLNDVKAAADKAAADKAAAAKAAASSVNTATVTAAQAKKASDLGVTTITLGPKVKKIAKNAFKGTKITTIIVKTKKLKKSSVKGSLKGSSVKTIKVAIGKKKVNKKYVKKYKKIFTKKNAGKKAKVK